MATICTADDFEGLRWVALELMEEAFDAPKREQLERLSKMAENSDKVLASMPSRRTLSPGYYMWIGAIMESVAGPMEAGVRFHSSDLRAEEALALLAIHEARADFRRAHPPCHGCGRALPDAQQSYCEQCERAKWEAEARSRR